jgi:hypothetical protein
LTLPTKGIATEVIREMMPPYQRSTDLRTLLTAGGVQRRRQAGRSALRLLILFPLRGGRAAPSFRKDSGWCGVICAIPTQRIIATYDEFGE